MLFTWMWPDGVIEPVSWEFGENGMNISYSFTDVGENKVNLIVLNKTTGCADTLDFVIDVQGLNEINNVFSFFQDPSMVFDHLLLQGCQPKKIQR